MYKISNNIVNLEFHYINVNIYKSDFIVLKHECN